MSFPLHLRHLEPVTRVVLGSLVVGAASALILALVAFPGATESVVTGSLLVGFGAGWGTLAVASGRRAGRPQRWARVPAVAMAATGAGLVAFSPDDAALSVVSWVWPPLMLALVAWMFVQARRALPAGPRRLLVPVFAALAAVSVGALVQDVSAPRVLHTHPAPGRVLTVGDHHLHIDCRGAGGPTVVLFNGLGEFSASWARIADQAGTTTRVCAYDRAGQGWSDDVDEPQDGVTAAADLHALLAAAGEHGPYVLVGHSIGGPYALTYAAQYPQDVAGMVLLDSSSPRQFADMPAYPMQYALMKRGLSLLPTLARVGLGPVIGPSSHLPGAEGDVVEAMGSTVRAERNGRDELSVIPRVFEQSQALTTLGDRPLVVLTASGSLGDEGWSAAQDRLAALSSDSVHRGVDASHAGMVGDPNGWDAATAAITAVARSVRTGSAVSLP
ncbi:pimeloyl-ACP methyl ester carboxylesterase [Nocardioides ginsengisegetis]|uniref:Pimeloyl-ACP methyl ester carboxylesterase n=1 Tax=Nocardioides ginsengisegetis TaxID=661491 RepID=A0A7W3P8J4_9ACTN|nr:alpha/beta hydrolase [Nocardioides ginsengisegetis]MBA8802499.1 pimeloyl-ACP methyl ester carboxylesterase [Nocardioides ginsengisegetis]